MYREIYTKINRYIDGKIDRKRNWTDRQRCIYRWIDS